MTVAHNIAVRLSNYFHDIGCTELPEDWDQHAAAKTSMAMLPAEMWNSRNLDLIEDIINRQLKDLQQ